LGKKQITHRFGTVLPVKYNVQNESYSNLFPTEEIFTEIKHFLYENEAPDYIWLTTPTSLILYPGFSVLVGLIKQLNPKQKIGTYLNCALICREEIQRDLSKYDFIAINLNSIESSNFLRINPYCEDVSLEAVLEGLRNLKKTFKGQLAIYTMFFKGINDNISSITSLKKFLLDIMPEYISIGTYTGKGFDPISNGFKKTLDTSFKDLPFDIDFTF